MQASCFNKDTRLQTCLSHKYTSLCTNGHYNWKGVSQYSLVTSVPIVERARLQHTEFYNMLAVISSQLLCVSLSLHIFWPPTLRAVS